MDLLHILYKSEKSIGQHMELLEYELINNRDFSQALIGYNEKYKMQIKLEFNLDSAYKSEIIMKLLSSLYIKELLE